MPNLPPPRPTRRVNAGFPDNGFELAFWLLALAVVALAAANVVYALNR